jgi:hypothetical protein
MGLSSSDLGFKPDGRHSRMLTSIEGACVDVLGKGRNNAVSAVILSEQIFDPFFDRIELAKRDVRRLVNHLIIEHDLPILSNAGKTGGYWIAGSPEEVEGFHHAFYKRAMTGLLKASRGKKGAFVNMVDQATLFFDDPDKLGVSLGRLNLAKDKNKIPAFVQMVTRGLEKIKKDPQKYAAEIRKIQDRYGDVFMPKDKIIELKRATDKVHALLKDVG